MAHLISEVDSMVLVGQRAWHGLGEVLPAGSDLSPREAVRRVLPWTVSTDPVYRLNAAGAYVPISGYAATVRSDTDEALGVVSDGYTPVQNAVLGEFAEALAGADAAVRVETAGSLNRGRRVFVTARLPASIKVGANDETVPYLVLANAHDGTAALYALWSAVRVVCNNTLTMALGRGAGTADALADAGRAFRFRHTGDILARIGEARTALRIATSQTERFAALAADLAARPATPELLREFWGRCFVDLEGPRPTDVKAADAWDTKLGEVSRAWRTIYHGPTCAGAGMPAGSLWAALQAVTEWHDHERSASRVTGERRVHSSWFGAAALAKRQAVAVAASLV